MIGRKTYESPVITTYGSVEALTLGASGNQPDIIINVTANSITSDPSNPTCTSNVPYGGCFRIVTSNG